MNKKSKTRLEEFTNKDEIDSTIIQDKLYSNSRQGTAKKAIKILVDSKSGYKEPNKQERLNLLVAFAKRNKVIYGKAFDIVKVKSSIVVDLENLVEVEKHLDDIIIYEIKSTSKKELNPSFEKYFFGLSTAELLVAQNLKNHFKFIFVNTITKETLELSLKEVFEKAREYILHGVYSFNNN